MAVVTSVGGSGFRDLNRVVDEIVEDGQAAALVCLNHWVSKRTVLLPNARLEEMCIEAAHLTIFFHEQRCE